MRNGSIGKGILFGLPLLILGLGAAEPPWKSDTLDGGKLTVKTRFATRKDAKGEEFPLVEYIARTADSGDYRKCLAVLKDVSRQQDINDYKASAVIETVSEREQLAWFLLDMPWPLPRTDIAARMTVLEEADGKSARILLDTVITPYKRGEARRVEVFRIAYGVRDLGGGKVELSSHGRFSAPIQVPLWMIKSAFPASAADPLRKVLRLARRP